MNECRLGNGYYRRLGWNEPIEPGDIWINPSTGNTEDWSPCYYGKTFGQTLTNIGPFFRFMIKHFEFERQHWLNRFQPMRPIDR